MRALTTMVTLTTTFDVVPGHGGQPYGLWDELEVRTFRFRTSALLTFYFGPPGLEIMTRKIGGRGKTKLVFSTNRTERE